MEALVGTVMVAAWSTDADITAGGNVRVGHSALILRLLNLHVLHSLASLRNHLIATHEEYNLVGLVGNIDGHVVHDLIVLLIAHSDQIGLVGRLLSLHLKGEIVRDFKVGQVVHVAVAAVRAGVGQSLMAHCRAGERNGKDSTGWGR